MSWYQFWKNSSTAFLNERHRDAQFARVADDILSVLRPGARAILDYGCGEALDADRIADCVEQLYLYDISPSVRANLIARFQGNTRIAILDETGGIAPASLDLIVVNSVIQYLSRDDLVALLGRWHEWLAPGGMLVIADVVPPNYRALDYRLRDGASLLMSAWRYGFLKPALKSAGGAAGFGHAYRDVRASVGLTAYTEQEIRTLLKIARFDVERVRRNFGLHQVRMTFIGVRR